MRNCAVKQTEDIANLCIVNKSQKKRKAELKGYCKYISIIWTMFVAFVLTVAVESVALGQALAGILIVAVVLQVLGW